MNTYNNKSASSIDSEKLDKNLSSEHWGGAISLAMNMLSEKQRKTLTLNRRTDCTSRADCTSLREPDCQGFELDQQDDPNEILRAIYVLANRESSNLCAQIELLVRFDELKGWRDSGSKSCAAWMNAHLQIDHRTAWERLRVGRCLRDLPVIRRLFQLGRLSWSKVRLLTRIANADNEKLLANASIDASVSDVQRICEEFRWGDIDDDQSDIYQAKLQHERRALTWKQLPDGNTQIRIVLPPEQAQNLLHSIEQCEDILYQDTQINQDNECSTDRANNNDEFSSSPLDNCVAKDAPEVEITASQRRADAIVLLAERSLAFQGNHLTQADRFQVVLNIEKDSLYTSHQSADASAIIPPRKPMIEGVGPIPNSTARKIACDCSIITMTSDEGEPLSIGRKQRIWPPSMRRAILTRDRHCQFPGCASHRFLQIHHIKHWADGGDTSVNNGICLCQHHHQLVHSENYSISRSTVESNELGTTGLFPASKKKLLPTRCRFVFKRLNDIAQRKLSNMALLTRCAVEKKRAHGGHVNSCNESNDTVYHPPETHKPYSVLSAEC